MTHEFWNVYLPVLRPLVVFVFGMSITPGPNNMMLMASGAQFGVRKTLLHIYFVSLLFVDADISCIGLYSNWNDLYGFVGDFREFSVEFMRIYSNLAFSEELNKRAFQNKNGALF